MGFNLLPIQQRADEVVLERAFGSKVMYVYVYVWSSHIAEYGSTG